MQRILPPFLALVLLALAGPAARAEGSAGGASPRRSSFSLGLFGGGHRFADEANLGVASSPEATAGAHSHGLAGLRATLELRPWAGVEVEAFGMLTTDRTYDRRASILGYRLNAVAYLMPGNFRPFALVGAGVLEVATTEAEGPAGLVFDRDGEFHVGVGLDYRLLDHLALRADARAVQLPGKLRWSLTTDLEASLGVVFLLGAGPRPGIARSAAAALPPVAPVRHDAAAPEPAPPSATAVVAPAPAAAPPPPAVKAPPPPPSPPPSPAASASPPPPSPAAASPSRQSDAPAEPSGLPPAAPPAPTPSAVAREEAKPRSAMVTATPVPTIPRPHGRLPSLAESLGRADEIRFDGSSSSKLSLAALPLVGQLAEALAKAPEVQIEIVAHTAGSGDTAKDLALSKRRADAVKRALVEREVKPSRLLSSGRGSSEPRAPNITRSGRKLNDRVELRIWTPEKMVR
jgi:outer membrane protein OmpA-like peptidoglycan-associated protein